MPAWWVVGMAKGQEECCYYGSRWGLEEVDALWLGVYPQLFTLPRFGSDEHVAS
jgi:hypothetical protein